MDKPTKTEVQAMIGEARKYAENGHWWANGINDRFARVVKDLQEIKRML